jgi:hypothetical protein
MHNHSLDLLIELNTVNPVGAKWKKQHNQKMYSVKELFLNEIHQELYGKIGVESDLDWKLEQSFNEFID